MQEPEVELENKDIGFREFVKRSSLWNKSWFLLSAFMNGISLINIGIDLKIVVFRWEEITVKDKEALQRIEGGS